MYTRKMTLQKGALCLIILAALIMIGTTCVQAQYWSAMPPYNLLWPLWSPALSPVDAVTGLATPLLSSLTANTILPVQPALAWDPARQYPWLFYNVPPVLGGGLTFFDPYYGLNPFPPASFTDPLTNLPNPLTLPLGYNLLAPTSISDFGPFVGQGNLLYGLTYPVTQFGIPVSSLLTAANIWGLPLI